MNKLAFGLSLALTSLAFSAKAVSSTASGGDWWSPDSWNGGVPPVAGGSADILGSATMTVKAGDVVTNTFLWIYRDASGGAQMVLESGACVTNCRTRVGVTSGTPKEGCVARLVINDGASFVKEAGSGDGKGTEFTTYEGSEIIQKGGLVWSDVNESFSSRGFYDQQGGTNSANIIQIANATYDPETFTTYHLHQGAYLDMPSFMVSAGTAILQGDWNKTGQVGRGLTQFYAGGVGNSNGRILFLSVTNTLSSGLYVGTHSSQVRQNPTGVVDFVNAEMTFAKSPSVATSNGQNGRGVLRFDNSRIWAKAGIDLLDNTAFTARGGRTAYLAVTNGANVATMAAAFTGNPWTCSDADFFAWQAGQGASVGSYFYPGSEVLVENGTYRVSDRIFFGGGKVRIGNKGKMACYRFYSTASTTAKTVDSGEIIVEDGGEFYVHASDFCFGPPNQAAMGPYVGDQTFRLRGGRVTLPSGMIKLGASENTTRFEVSGGTLDPNTVFFYNVPGSVEVAFKGSSYTADISGVYTNKTGGFVKDDVLLEFTLDKSPNHIQAVNYSGSNAGGTYTPRRCGNLRVKLDGGILVTDRDQFTLLTTSHKNSTFNDFGGAGDFLSLPDANLWEEVLSSNSRTCSVQLVAATCAAKWDEDAIALAKPLPMGSVELSNVSTNKMKELCVGLSVKAADGSALGDDALAALKDNLVAAGYTNSVCEAGAAYNLTAVIPPDAIGNGNRRFVWDFTETKGIKTIDTVVTNALVTALSFRSCPLHTGMTLIFR